MIPPDYSGSGVRAYEYALRLHKKNKLAFILTQNHKPAIEGRNFKFKRFKKISSDLVITAPRDMLKKRKKNKSRLIYVFRFILYQIHLFSTLLCKYYQKRDSFVIIHCIQAGSWISLYSVFIGKMLGKKTILEMTLLNSDDPLSIKNNSNKLISFFRYWLFSQANIFISISPALTKAYTLSGMSINRLRKVPNSVDINKFCPVDSTERSVLRKRLGYKENAIIILFVGGIIKRKRIDLLIKSFSQFKNHYNNAILLLLGPIPSNSHKEHSRHYSEYLEMGKLINDLEIKEYIHFLGVKDNVDEYMKISDLFLFLSQNEGLPNVLLEAMSVGLPVVTLKIPGITEYLIRKNYSGMIVDEDNPYKIFLEMDNLFKNHNLYKKISINSRKTILNKFTHDVIDKEYEKIYKEIID